MRLLLLGLEVQTLKLQIECQFFEAKYFQDLTKINFKTEYRAS